MMMGIHSKAGLMSRRPLPYGGATRQTVNAKPAACGGTSFSLSAAVETTGVDRSGEQYEVMILGHGLLLGASAEGRTSSSNPPSSPPTA